MFFVVSSLMNVLFYTFYLDGLVLLDIFPLISRNGAVLRSRTVDFCGLSANCHGAASGIALPYLRIQYIQDVLLQWNTQSCIAGLTSNFNAAELPVEI